MLDMLDWIYREPAVAEAEKEIQVETQIQMCQRLYESWLYLWFGFPDTEEITCQASHEQSSF